MSTDHPPPTQDEIEAFQGWSIASPVHAKRLQEIAARRFELGAAGDTAANAHEVREAAREALLDAQVALDEADAAVAAAEARYETLLSLDAEERQILRMHNLRLNLYDTFHPSVYYNRES